MNPITLVASDGQTQAVIYPELGGVCASFLVEGSREIFYRPPEFETLAQQKICGGLPFHFPACGRTEGGVYPHEGCLYHMPTHGFSAQMPWTVEFFSLHQAILKLTDSLHTRSFFPFAFELRLGYELQPNALQVSLSVINRDTQPMVYSMGLHPYFLIPVAEKSGTQIDFTAAKSLAYNERLTDLAGERDIQAPMPAYLTDEGLNERLSVLSHSPFQQALSKTPPPSVRLIYAKGSEIHMTLGADHGVNPFEFLQLYHQPDAPFFCIEPWAGTPNAWNHPERLLTLAPGQSCSCWLNLQFYPQAK